MVTTIGTSTLYVGMICTAIDHDGGTTAHANASADVLYFICKQAKGSESMNANWKDLVGGSNTFIADGKKTMNVSISEMWCLPYGAVTSPTDSFNNHIDFIRKKGRSGSGYLYLFLRNTAETKDVYLSYSTAGASQNYLKGVIQSMDWDFNIMSKIESLKFRGV